MEALLRVNAGPELPDLRLQFVLLGPLLVIRDEHRALQAFELDARLEILNLAELSRGRGVDQANDVELSAVFGGLGRKTELHVVHLHQAAKSVICPRDSLHRLGNLCCRLVAFGRGALLPDHHFGGSGRFALTLLDLLGVGIALVATLVFATLLVTVAFCHFDSPFENSCRKLL